jgi:dipeptidyl aminopeptidase/acylaminoacyl peptidase
MQLYMGGSHGGFLGAHGKSHKSLLTNFLVAYHPGHVNCQADAGTLVIGQYPSFFSAAVLRNPVINIPAMHATTDIPDWAAVECGITYDPCAVLTPKQYKAMYQKSPIQYVDKVTTPVLLRIGDVDQRVPPSQGREYYHLLKANGMGDKVEMLWYPENGHPLDKLEAERAGWDATLAWFKRYGPEKSS